MSAMGPKGERNRADERLERLLYLLPAAQRPGGASLQEVAGVLESSATELLQDLDELARRAFHHPGGWVDDLQVFVTGDRVQVGPARAFGRPHRLSSRETLCLALALRGTFAAARLPDEGEREVLLARVEAHLAVAGTPDGTAGFRLTDLDPDPSGIRERLLAACSARRPCRLAYLKSGSAGLEDRPVQPWHLAHARGHWYLIAWCRLREDPRLFRLDRILEVVEEEGSFRLPDDFDPAQFTRGAQVYWTRSEVEVRIRYAPRIARWIQEQLPAWGLHGEETEDGALEVAHRVSDPLWAVSHVLTYGRDARILHPPEVSEMVSAALEGVWDAAPPAPSRLPDSPGGA